MHIIVISMCRRRWLGVSHLLKVCVIDRVFLGVDKDGKKISFGIIGKDVAHDDAFSLYGAIYEWITSGWPVGRSSWISEKEVSTGTSITTWRIEAEGITLDVEDHTTCVVSDNYIWVDECTFQNLIDCIYIDNSALGISCIQIVQGVGHGGFYVTGI